MARDEGHDGNGMTGTGGQAGRGSAGGRLLLAASALGVLLSGAMLARIAATRGPWLDEFWSLWAITPSAASIPLIERWLSDVHPIVWPALAWGLGDVAGNELPARRIAVNGIAWLLWMAGSAVLWRARPANAPFLFAFAVAVIGTPMIALSFADFRPYFVHVCAFALLLAAWAHLQQDARDYAPGQDRAVLAVAAPAMLLSLTLHYVGALIASVTVALFLVILWRQQRRGWALRLGATAGLGWVFMLVSAAVQSSRWRSYLDVRWIDTTPGEAALLGVHVVTSAFYLTPAFALALLAGWRLNLGPSPALRRVALPALGAVLVSGALLFLLNLASPVLIARYLLLWVPLLCVAVAAVAAPVLDRRWTPPLLLGLLLYSGGTAVRQSPGLESWREGTREIAARAGACPGTRVYWLSAWRFSPAHDSRAARRERQAYVLGYGWQAARHGFVAEPLPEDGVIDLRGARCPTLVWVEHFPTPRFASAEAMLAAARIRLVGLAPGARPLLLQPPAARILVIPPPAGTLAATGRDATKVIGGA